jgi:hypothetical protein
VLIVCFFNCFTSSSLNLEASLLTVILCKPLQVKAMVAGVENLVMISNDVVKQVRECEDVDSRKSNVKPNAGMQEFEAWMRMLDAQVLSNQCVIGNFVRCIPSVQYNGQPLATI